jgi:UDP-N-acetyl-2-amino-2-deoxyglucuronate dehydrogenase
MAKLRFGLTGSGYMGRTHAEAIRRLGAEAELVAVWGGSRAPELAARFGIACEATVESLTRRPDLDAVVVTTPNHQHVTDATLALEAGKHVLVEKPFALSVADCDRMIAAAARRGLVVATAYNLRFRTNPPKARKLIAAGTIGRVQSMHYSMIRRLDDNFGGSKVERWHQTGNLGFFIDGLPHGLDLMRWFMGAEVARVGGFCRTFLRNPEVEDTDVGVIEFTNGAVCSVHTTMAGHAAFPGEEAHLGIVGSEGILNLDAFGQMHLSDRRGGWRLVSTQPRVPFDQPDAAFTDLGRMQAFIDQMQSFIDGIQGKPMQAATGADGRAGVAACLGLLESSKAGAFVRLE